MIFCGSKATHPIWVIQKARLAVDHGCGPMDPCRCSLMAKISLLKGYQHVFKNTSPERFYSGFRRGRLMCQGHGKKAKTSRMFHL